MAETDLKTAAKLAWLYTLPLIEIAAVRARGLSVGSRMNAFGHMRNLADHTSRAVTTPNNDTLYSTAQIDLSQGPVSITLPPAGERYISLQLMDAYSNSFAVLGTRTTGPEGGTFTLVGPGEAAEGPNVVRAPTRHVWALARVLVEGPHDLEAARAVQHGVSAQGPEVAPPPAFANRGAGWADYFRTASQLLTLNPPPVTDRAMLARMAPLGLGEGFDPSRFSPEEAQQIEAGAAEARREARGGGGLVGGQAIEGWTYPNPRLGDFGQDYGLRATVALGGLAALPVVEASYFRAIGPMPRGLFDGGRLWRLHFAAQAHLPVDSF